MSTTHCPLPATPGPHWLCVEIPWPQEATELPNETDLLTLPRPHPRNPGLYRLDLPIRNLTNLREWRHVEFSLGRSEC
jgi:hypothetical protein